MPISAYQKDTTAIQEFLAGRIPCLGLDSHDVIRAERYLLELTAALGRPLYTTINGYGVFRKNIGDVDYPVVKFLNEDFLTTILVDNDIPELSLQEIEEVDKYFDALETVNFDASKVSMKLDNIPKPILNLRIDIPDVVTPLDCHPKDLDRLIQHSNLMLDEFLVRLRVKLRGSKSTPGTSRVNPLLLALDPKTPMYAMEELDPDNIKSPAAKVWVCQLPGLFGQQYGIEAEKQPTPWNQCLDLVSRGDPKANIVLLMEGFRDALPDPDGRITNQSSLKDLEWAIRKLEKSTNQVIIMAPGVEWKNSEVDKFIVRYSLNYPDLDDLNYILRAVIRTIYAKNKERYFELVNNIIKHDNPKLFITEESEESNDELDETDDSAALESFDAGILKAANSLRGLTETRIQNVIWSMIRSYNDLDPNKLDQSRREIINKTAGLKVIDIKASSKEDPFGNVGGLEELKDWIKSRGADLFLTVDQAQEQLGGYVYKGILLVGLPGTGKSLIVKSIAKYLAQTTIDYPVSLVSLDTGALRGQYVGESEKNTREALMMVEAFSPCVLWIDEIEKAFSGSGGDSSSEISRRMLGYFLTWMQERTSPVLLVATSNDISSLPPEFTREGRWDAKFYTPLPDEKAAMQILNYVLSRFKVPLGKIVKNTENGNRKILAWATYAKCRNFDGKESPIKIKQGDVLINLKNEQGEPVMRFLGYSGAEIEASIKEAVSRAKAKYAELWPENLTIDDLVVSLKNITPKSQTFDDKGQSMGYIMYKLETIGTKPMSDEDYFKAIEAIKKQSNELKDPSGKVLTDSEVDAIVKNLEEIAKTAKRRKNPRRNPSTSMYLLGDGLFDSLFS